MESLVYDFKNTDKYDLLILSGEINSKNNECFLKEINKLVMYDKILILNLKQLQYVDSSGVYTLMTIIKSLEKNKLHLYAYNLNDKIRDIFKLVGLSKYLKEINSSSLENFLKSR